ncbi:MAG: GIY-YIG nuclease family protein, partial [Nitrosotalea sp.]
MTLDISKVSIPSHPGIYIMKDETEKILYIGKAKNLKNRVKS